MSRRKQLNPRILLQSDLKAEDGSPAPLVAKAEPVEADGNSQDSSNSSLPDDKEDGWSSGESGADGDLACSYCPERFTDSAALGAHEQVHALLMPHHCRHCGKGFKHKRSQDRHEQLHTGNKKHKCPHCSAAFFRSDHLKLHLRTHEGGSHSGGSRGPSDSPPAAHRCCFCPASYGNPETLLRHLDKEHPSLSRRSPTPASVCSPAVGLREATPSESPSDPRYACSQCGRSFDSILALHSHANAAHPADLSPPKSAAFPCPACSGLFGSQAALAAHAVAEHPLPTEVPSTLTCEICRARVAPAALEAHTIHHFLQSSGGSMSCPGCGVEFPGRAELSVHQLAEHIIPVLSCRICNQSFAGGAAEAAAHMERLHGPEPREWRCRTCNASFEAEAAFRVHVEVVHLHRSILPAPTAAQVQASLHTLAAQHTPYKCPVCPEAFNVEFLLERHMASTHAGDQPFAFPPSTANGSSGGPTDLSRSATPGDRLRGLQFPSPGEPGSPAKCNICDASLESPELLRRHKLAHCKVVQADSCTVCHGGLGGEADFLDHTRRHNTNGGVAVACVVCRQSLASVAELELHAGFHLSGRSPSDASAPAKPYQCIKCQASFGTEAEIQSHVISSHVIQEGLENQCNLCRAVLDSPAKLQVHLIEHSFAGCPELRCYLCQAVFSLPGPLRDHILSHPAAQKPYDCPKCAQAFFFRAELEHHVVGHGTTSSPPPTTSASGSSSTTSPSATGGQHQCPHCPKAFASLSALQGHSHVHMNSGHGAAAHPCPACPKAFSSAAKLRNHARVHIEASVGTPVAASLHQCSFCARVFSRRDNLRVHMRVHEGGEELPTMVPFPPREGIAS